MRTARFTKLYDDKNAGAFLSSMLMLGIAVGIVSGTLNNYLYDVLSITRIERGIVEFPRELPGLLLVFIVAAFSRFSEHRLMTGAFVMCASGLAGLAVAGYSRVPAVIFIVMWSFGEHLMMPVRDSISMHMAKPGKAGAAMGMTGGWMNAGQVLGSYSVPLLFLLVPLFTDASYRFLAYRVSFVLGAAILAAAIVLNVRRGRETFRVSREKLTFKRKYLRYYILEVFFGARKQVFLTFAPYVLIVQYGAGTEYVAFLYGFWSLSNILAAPLMGRLLDRFGYRKVIIADSLIIVVLCLSYGFSHRLFSTGVSFVIVSVVFVVDAVMFLASMARSMYIRSIAADRNEVTSTLSTGISVNHLVSILIAVLGGLLWEKLGMETLFTIAALFGAGSFVFSLALPKTEKTVSPA